MDALPSSARASMVAAGLSALVACGGPGAGAEHAGSSAQPTRCVAAPEGASARRAAVDDVARRAWAAMRGGDPTQLLLDDVALRLVLSSESATRLAAMRLTTGTRLGSTEDFGAMLDRAEYAGVCLQGARDEPAGGVLGLREDGWIFERMLIIGRRENGRRVAAWVEGTFVHTDAGFHALDLERVERPRWEHSDLELAPCDLSIRED